MDKLIEYDIEVNRTKFKIFREAARLFSEKGYHGVSMREISERAEVTKPTIYYYFGSKEGVYKELVKVGVSVANEDIRYITKKNKPVKERLVELISTRFDYCFEHPIYVKYFIDLKMSSEKLPFLVDFEKNGGKKHKKILVNMIQEGVKTGEFGAGARPELAIEIIEAVILHFMLKQLKTEKKILTDQLAADIVELLFKGLNE